MKKTSAVLLMLIALPALAKEPLNISETQANGKRVLVVSGSNGTSCKVPISDDNKMSGISCK